MSVAEDTFLLFAWINGDEENMEWDDEMGMLTVTGESDGSFDPNDPEEVEKLCMYLNYVHSGGGVMDPAQDTCKDMIQASLEACDADQNGKIDACEAYSCELAMENLDRADMCPSGYDPRPMGMESCAPCLDEGDSFVDLDFYGLTSCSSKSTNTFKTTKKGSIKLARELFKAVHKKAVHKKGHAISLAFGSGPK